jgi:Nucleotidyl transferase AbiEii toxin, Type IV TA system
MTVSNQYKTPGAFRTALTAKLKKLAESSQWEFDQLRQQITYDRLLARLYLHDDQWIVKGAIALLARDLGVRATKDIDVFRRDALDNAEAELRAAASHDTGDWFRFEIGMGSSAGEGSDALRLPAAAYIGLTVWHRFHVDLTGDSLRMVGHPEDVPPLARIEMPNIEQRGYRVYPLVDHIADKMAATFQRYGQSNLPSTRFKDLVDLVAIVSAASVEAGPQVAALRSEADRRDITLPTRFAVPDRRMWENGYAAEAGRSLLPTTHTLDEALALVCPFADPLLDGSAQGRWDASAGSWVT